MPRSPAPSPAQIELAQKVIKATQMDRMFDQMSSQMQQMAAQSMNRAATNQTPAQKEAATHPLFGLVDRDVLPGYLCVEDEIASGRQSAKPASDDMRLHRPAPRIPNSRA